MLKIQLSSQEYISFLKYSQIENISLKLYISQFYYLTIFVWREWLKVWWNHQNIRKILVTLYFKVKRYYMYLVITVNYVKLHQQFWKSWRLLVAFVVTELLLLLCPFCAFFSLIHLVVVLNSFLFWFQSSTRDFYITQSQCFLLASRCPSQQRSNTLKLFIWFIN